jgi:hypothetical protein
VRAIEVSERSKKKLLRGAVQQVFRRNPTGATYTLVGFDMLIGNVDMVVLGLWNVMNSGGECKGPADGEPRRVFHQSTRNNFTAYSNPC